MSRRCFSIGSVRVSSTHVLQPLTPPARRQIGDAEPGHRHNNSFLMPLIMAAGISIRPHGTPPHGAAFFRCPAEMVGL